MSLQLIHIVACHSDIGSVFQEKGQALGESRKELEASWCGQLAEQAEKTN